MPKDHKCQFCEKTFSIPSLRDKHMNAVHYKIKDFKCSHCPEKLQSIDSLKSHMLEVHKEVPQLSFTCDKCGNNYPTASHLKIHMKRHNETEDFKCDQ